MRKKSEAQILSIYLCECLYTDSPLFCLWVHVGIQFQCRCGRWSRHRKDDRHHLCASCDYNRRYPPLILPPPPSLPPVIPVEHIVTHNVSSLMSSLPIHSHHRASLVHYLSRDLPSTVAARLLHTTPSYVRQCKRKNYDDADLFTDK